MNIVVNGQERPVAAESTALDLLRALDLDPGTVVVEVNRTIIRRPALADTRLRDGDVVELVHFVGGG